VKETDLGMVCTWPGIRGSTWAARAGWGVEGDRLSVAEPHREVCNRRLLVLQPRREVAASRDERVGFVNQVAREGPGEEPLVR